MCLISFLETSEIDSETERLLLETDEDEVDVITSNKMRIPMKFLATNNCKRTFNFDEINSIEYWEEVCRLICTRFDCGANLTLEEYLTFEQNIETHGGMKRKTPSPSIDAWFLVGGKVREGFNVQKFFKKYQFIENQLEFVRKELGIIIEKTKLF